MDGPPSEGPEPTTASNNAELNNVAMLATLLILAAALVCGRMVQRARIKWIGEASVGLVVGLLVGLVLHFAKVGPALGGRMSFKASVFLLVFMPTIMFHAGYTLNAAPFLENLGSICMTAFLGTTISTFVIGVMMWAFGAWGWCYSMPLLYNLTFGALISATDPVAVLAVFDNVNASKSLYINVFGESVLNDAVAMVLYNTISRFLDVPVTAAEVFKGIGIFIGIFLGSVLVGVALGFLAALIFRTGFFRAAAPSQAAAPSPVLVVASSEAPDTEQRTNGSAGTHARPLFHDCKESSLSPAARPQALDVKRTTPPGPPPDTLFDSPSQPVDEQAAIYETSLALVLAYISYMASSALFLSGITAIIATGMLMNVYLRPNISTHSNMRVSIVSKTLAITFELFSFVYIGLSVLQPQDWGIARYTILCLGALAVSRACNIYPLCAVVNFLRPPERRISRNQQFMLWWSGLRGPMAFALALDASEKYGSHGTVMKTCTLYLILITVLFNGGLTAHLVAFLKLTATDEEKEAQEQQNEDAWLLADQIGTPAAEHGERQPVWGSREPEGGLASQRAVEGRPTRDAGVGGGAAESRGHLTELSLLGLSTEANVHSFYGRSNSLGLLPANSLSGSGGSASPSGKNLTSSRILERIRDFNSGRLTDRLSGIDRVVTRLLVGDPEHNSSGLARQTLASPAAAELKPEDLQAPSANGSAGTDLTAAP